MKKYTWANSRDDVWENDMFNSVEECFADAKENCGMKIDETICIGECVLYAPMVDVESILDKLEEEAYDIVGESAESWSAYNTTEKGKLEELREELALVIMEWFKKNDNEPNLYYINGFVTRSIT